LDALVEEIEGEFEEYGKVSAEEVEFL